MATDVKRQIADVLIKKAKTNGLDKVTVSMIVKECGISRQAFYYYYQDIVDVVRYLIREGLKNIYEEGENAHDPREGVSIFVEDIVRQFPLISIAVNSKYRGELEALLVDQMRQFFSFALSHMEYARDLRRDQIEFHADFIACGVVFYTIEHCGDTGFDKESFKKNIWNFLNRVYRE
ncbi:MAG: TetR/AcrR family transcriptional regulator [Lachnospiraceae bacterium]|nr:TetR/AcrR family transcriptional regulator [Lachnospiraceae bacterium]